MQPPDLPGYNHVRLLGSGGYSDVFLYEQEMPRRQVAIKVLLAEAHGAAGREKFFAEANAMAAVSTHPHIVSVFHAEVSASGHPYLVMEYYPRDNFSVRARNERIPVYEALRVGVQVASAVETAHRAGILHRDIKPANILTSEYDRPGLTDFGIATASNDSREAEGMSIPWSPPEVVNGTAPGDATADVYSLAATVHTLLSGRSPFEIPGESNKAFHLIPRIDAGGPQRTGRPDVPESLERLLRHGMSKFPADRPSSALQFAQMLQAVEVEEGYAATQLEISQDPRDIRTRNTEIEDDGTRLKGPTVIHSQPQGPDSGTISRNLPVGTSAPAAEGTVPRGSRAAGGSEALISGIGERPVGLSGRAAPRPVAPMPSAESGVTRAASQNLDAADPLLVDVVDPVTPRRMTNWRRLALGGVLCVALLAGIGFAFSGGGCDAGDPDCDSCPAGEPGCEEVGPSTNSSIRLPEAASTPSKVTVVDNGNETWTISWTPGAGSEPASYVLLDQDGTRIRVTSDGATAIAPEDLVEEGGRLIWRGPLPPTVSCIDLRASSDDNGLNLVDSSETKVCV